MAFPGASVVQNQTDVQELYETWAWPLDWDDSLEKGMAMHSSIPARRIPWIEEPGYRQSVGGASRHHWSDLACTHKVVIYRHVVVAIQSLSCVGLFVSLGTTASQASLPFTISWSLFKLMSIELVMPSNHLELCHPLDLLPSVFPSIRVFSKESALRIRWSKYWSFSFSISRSDEYSGLISFRIDWFYLLAVQVTLKSLLQHHSFKSINSSALSLPYKMCLWGSLFCDSQHTWQNRESINNCHIYWISILKVYVNISKPLII